MKKLFTMIAIAAFMAACCGNAKKAATAEGQDEGTRTEQTECCKAECECECKCAAEGCTEACKCESECKCAEKCCKAEGEKCCEVPAEAAPAAEATPAQ